MPTFDCTVQATLNASDLPGFPFQAHLQVGQVLTFVQTITQTTGWVNIFNNTSIDQTAPAVALFLQFHTAALLAVNDALHDDPIAMAANSVFGWVRGIAPVTLAVKALTNPTTFRLIIATA